MNTSQPSIHGHQVLDMMTESGKTYSLASLETDISIRFGLEARFHTCSAEHLSAAQLIELLWNHGKFQGTPTAFVFDPSTKCSE